MSGGPGEPSRVAIVHDWLVTPGGAELVLRELVALFPRADLFALVDHLSVADRSELGIPRATTTFLQHVPGSAHHYRSFLPLMPLAVLGLDVSGYDLVISNSHAVAKGVRTHDKQLHLCYCLSPMRYAWDLRDQYLREAGLERGMKGGLARVLLERMRKWDLANTSGVDSFATLSKYIAERIGRAYGRTARVIYPPVDTGYFDAGSGGREAKGVRRGEQRGEKGGVYVTASRFVPYKRVDLIARAFTRLLPDRQLVIAGDGPDEAKVRAAAGANVLLAGRLPRESLRELLRRARAFVFAAEEDFGIAPVEAMACGTPVIAYAKGGVTESVTWGPDGTGVVFEEQSEAAIADAVRRFEALAEPIRPERCRERALLFGAERFRSEFGAWVGREWEGFAHGP